MSIRDIANEMEYAWIEEGDGVYVSCERTGIELFFDKKGAAEFIRKELASPRGNALKHRHKVLAQAHNDDLAAYLNGLVGFTGERMMAAILLMLVCVFLALWLVFDQAIKSSCDHEFELKGLSHTHDGDSIEHYECKKCGRGVFKREFY